MIIIFIQEYEDKSEKKYEIQDNNYDVTPDTNIEELIEKSLQPVEMPSKPDELISKDLNVLYENNPEKKKFIMK